MSYLTGKRCKDRGEELSSKTKHGVIINEPFPNNQDGSFYNTCVAVLWDDGSMEGAIDVELLKVVEADVDYVVCATWSDSMTAVPGSIIKGHGAILHRVCETMEDAELYCEHIKSAPFNAEKTRIGKVIFPFD